MRQSVTTSSKPATHERSLLLGLALMIGACGGEVVASTEPQTTITTASPATSTTVPTATTTTSASEPVVLLPLGASTPGAQLTLNMPDGWTTYKNFAVLKNFSNPPDGMGVGFWTVGNIYTDRCQWQEALLDPALGPTVDDLTTALAEHWGSDATAPIDVTLGGFAGKQMVLTVPTDIGFSDCDQGEFRTWIGVSDGVRYYQGPGQSDQLWILDVDGVRLVILASYFPETTAEDRAEQQQMVNSIEIQP